MAVSTIDKVPVLTGLQERVQDNGADTSITPGATLFDRQDQRVAPVAATKVAISSPAAGTALVASTDTLFTFATTTGEAFSVRRVYIENNSDGGTPGTLWVAFDAAAGLGTAKLRPGEWRSFDVPCNVLHLFSTATLVINGAADGQVLVWGWL